ncbi:hypothetical protein DFQ14_12310 [Halopolyspora algeriensis]|uniref:Uncharacterized protein n=1 Tax=Halopolyspora algeriensis TaxID=1500506 RepID=A0A368VCM5_9ACTN|nr:hypothetical protein [Halopolyspora algeriensis]RCW38443.1 hypothetical protein DFQ14_12310 [Halopolyspora algeriensis]TQM55758.1 hypothetical protein FHU43_0534 [Halopolyspora algeriensis]
MDFETPEADAAEQLHEDQNAEDQGGFDATAETSADVNPADMVEQQQIVPEDEVDERF